MNGYAHPEEDEETQLPEPEEVVVDHGWLGDYVPFHPPNFVKKGSSGKEVSLVANYFEVVTHPKFNMTLYEVIISPVVDDELKIQALVHSKRAELPKYMLNGLQLFTTMPIEENMLTCEAHLEDDPSSYTLRFRLKRKVRRWDPLVIQFQNALVNQIQNGLGYRRFGSSRAYFNPKNVAKEADLKVELWPGVQTSIRHQEQAQLLNVQVMWKVFRTEVLLHRLNRLKENCGGDTAEYRRRCREETKGMTVVTKHMNFGYTIDGVDFAVNPRSTFWPTEVVKSPGGDKRVEKKEVSYLDYYKQKYNVTIEDHTQPLLVIEPKPSEIRRGQKDPIHVVPELCYLCDEKKSRGGVPDSETRALKQYLHMPPTDRVSKMRDFVKSINGNVDKRAMLKEWGIKLSPEPVQLKGRVLQAQEIFLLKGQQSQQDSGNWTWDLQAKGMLSTRPLKRWALVVNKKDDNRLDVDFLVRTMQEEANHLGYEISRPEKVRVNGTDANSYAEGIDQAWEVLNGKVDLIFVILGLDEEVFSKVKQLCSIQFGVPSQCFLSKHLTPSPKAKAGLKSKCQKLVIQMAAKQGGEPWGIKNPFRADPVGVMVLGYDVHHGGPGSHESFGAMVSTLSSSLGKYYSTVQKITAARQEVSPSICRMFEECLKAFARHNNGMLPRRVIMYRDGVGEGQLMEVKDTEVEGFLEKMKSIYKELDDQKLGSLTYIIVNKRINTRFFKPPSHPSQEFKNPEIGLVVDDIVTRPERYDFYLLTNSTKQGCVKPTYYNVLYDDSTLTADQLQTFTFRLCHNYYNYSGTVGVPAPCLYADKLSKQTGIALKRPVHPNLADRLHFL